MKFEHVSLFVSRLAGRLRRASQNSELARNPIVDPDPEWHRKVVGGLWEEIGELQFDFLVEHGLRPEHYLLDVGCGAFRGGIHLIRYLDAGHYFGVDHDEQMLARGRIELNKEGLLSKQPTIQLTDSFDFTTFQRNFEYVWAFSLFTHLPVNSIIRCIMNAGKVMALGGKFFATFFENPMGKFNLEPQFHLRVDGEPFPTFFDRDYYHYDFETFEWICDGTDLKVAYIGDCFHPRDQKMLMFTKI